MTGVLRLEERGEERREKREKNERKRAKEKKREREKDKQLGAKPEGQVSLVVVHWVRVLNRSRGHSRRNIHLFTLPCKNIRRHQTSVTLRLEETG